MFQSHVKMLHYAISLKYAIFILKTFNSENRTFQSRRYYYVKITSLMAYCCQKKLDSSAAKLLKSHFGTN